ncbi:DnaT-like ssDNA-binding protein [Pseudomonas syringae]|uniref:DnaT-like ssDNA-binding protein n=1 Tax=Pseudomonas syringae CC1417 TaxID=1357272 RepID=A0AAU8LF72_PSESX
MPEFYGTVADADAYHAARANTAWTGDDMAKQAALIRASAYIDGRYRKQLPSGVWVSLFPGYKTDGRAQSLEWPRTDAFDYEGHSLPADEIPSEVERSTYEAALRELVTPGSLSPDYIASQTIKREKVGPLETEYAVGTDAAGSVRPVISIIDEMIAPVLVARYTLPAVFVV